MQKRLFALPLASLLLLTMLLSFVVATGSAHAATKSAQAPLTSACMQNPSPKNCDGQDPDLSGCGASGTTLVSVALGSNGTVALRYSTACHTAWSHAVSSIGVTTIQATITRKSDGKSYQTPFLQATAAKSLMVYVSGLDQANACGYIGGISRCTGWTYPPFNF